jgi:hypothetical protein
VAHSESLGEPSGSLVEGMDLDNHHRSLYLNIEEKFKSRFLEL